VVVGSVRLSRKKGRSRGRMVGNLKSQMMHDGGIDGVALEIDGVDGVRLKSDGCFSGDRSCNDGGLAIADPK
jgi:hypothetical protein